MTGRTSRTRKYIICFAEKSVIFGKITISLEKKWKRVDFFLAIFKIIDGSIECATKFHGNEIVIFLSIFVR